MPVQKHHSWRRMVWSPCVLNKHYVTCASSHHWDCNKVRKIIARASDFAVTGSSQIGPGFGASERSIDRTTIGGEAWQDAWLLFHVSLWLRGAAGRPLRLPAQGQYEFVDGGRWQWSVAAVGGIPQSPSLPKGHHFILCPLPWNGSVAACLQLNAY